MSRVKTMAPSVEREASAAGTRNNCLRWNYDAWVAAMLPCARDSSTAGAPTQLRQFRLIAPALPLVCVVLGLMPLHASHLIWCVSKTPLFRRRP